MKTTIMEKQFVLGGRGREEELGDPRRLDSS
jgi:hypothetical protein